MIKGLLPHKWYLSRTKKGFYFTTSREEEFGPFATENEAIANAYDMIDREITAPRKAVEKGLSANEKAFTNLVITMEKSAYKVLKDLESDQKRHM